MNDTHKWANMATLSFLPWQSWHSLKIHTQHESSTHQFSSPRTHLQMENQGEWIAWSPSGPGKPLNPLCPSSPLAPIMPCWPRGPGSPSMPCSMNRWITTDFSYNWRIFYFSFWSVVTYRRSWLAHGAQNSNGSRRSLKVMGGIEQCWCHPRMLSGGCDSVTGLFLLTLSPLSPLLPFWPVPPVSPCTESKAWAKQVQIEPVSTFIGQILSWAPCLHPLLEVQKALQPLEVLPVLVVHHAQQGRQAPSLPAEQMRKI